MAGKRTRTESLQRKAEGSTPPPVNVQARPAEGDPLPTSGQSYVDSIVHGAVDPAKVAAEQLAKGVHDENTITNEVFWACRPEVGRGKLTAGSPEAREWLRLRDEIVRPALHGHETRHAAPRAAPEITGGDLANAQAVVPRNDAVGPSGNALIDDLLAHVPPHGSPNQIEATWLLEALKTELFGAFPSTLGQLTQLSHGETLLRTSDGVSGADAIKRGVAELEKQKIHTQHVGTKGGRMEYAVDGGHLPILAVMIDLAAGRLREYVRGGMKNARKLFTFGDMVRADVDYAKDGKHSSHASGNAIDLGMNLKSEDDVVNTLAALPAGKISMVFPDGGAGGIAEHVHLALGDDGLYELGISFAGPFFQLSDSIFSRQKAAEEREGGAGAAVGATAEADGLVMWHPAWYQSKGVHKGGGKWEWTRKYAGKASPHLASAKLKKLLATLDSGKKRDVSVHAAKEDGVDPKKTEH
ncbi:MAG TPA: hypothetical protein VM261_03250 [Kofleriaceae bacterium]|nr:hypothetical protein [Kofleriaceae bacterium]